MSSYISVIVACDLVIALRKRDVSISVHDAVDILSELELSKASRLVAASGLYKAFGVTPVTAPERDVPPDIYENIHL